MDVEAKARELLAEECAATVQTVDLMTARGESLSFSTALRALIRALTPTDERVEAVARAMAELCSPPKGASFEQACEWVPPTIEDMARAAIAAMGGGRD